uniref:COX assembly mitochondrial protein n=1 Tax=Eptatretus burgeri TaxID=7764 RepID=A0A8C4WUY1_EPTBU
MSSALEPIKLGSIMAEEEPYLRHVEKDVLIPKIMRIKSREICLEKVDAFTRCCKDSGILMVVKCREENSELKECLTKLYKDPIFYNQCKQQYLEEREKFWRTGVPTQLCEIENDNPPVASCLM